MSYDTRVRAGIEGILTTLDGAVAVEKTSPKVATSLPLICLMAVPASESLPAHAMPDSAVSRKASRNTMPKRALKCVMDEFSLGKLRTESSRQNQRRRHHASGLTAAADEANEVCRVRGVAWRRSGLFPSDHSQREDWVQPRARTELPDSCFDQHRAAAHLSAAASAAHIPPHPSS